MQYLNRVVGITRVLLLDMTPQSATLRFVGTYLIMFVDSIWMASASLFFASGQSEGGSESVIGRGKAIISPKKRFSGFAVNQSILEQMWVL